MKRSKPRKRKAQKESSSAEFGAGINLAADAWLVPASRTKHGGRPRRGFGPIGFTALALQAIYKSDPRDHHAIPDIIDAVDTHLAADPKWHEAGYYRQVPPQASRNTVRRAMARVWGPRPR